MVNIPSTVFAESILAVFQPIQLVHRTCFKELKKRLAFPWFLPFSFLVGWNQRPLISNGINDCRGFTVHRHMRRTIQQQYPIGLLTKSPIWMSATLCNCQHRNQDVSWAAPGARWLDWEGWVWFGWNNGLVGTCSHEANDVPLRSSPLWRKMS